MYWVSWYDIFVTSPHASQRGISSQSNGGKCLGGCACLRRLTWRAEDETLTVVCLCMWLCLVVAQRQRSSTRRESWQSQASAWLYWWWASCAWWPTAKPSKYTGGHFCDHAAVSLIRSGALHTVVLLSTTECVDVVNVTLGQCPKEWRCLTIASPLGNRGRRCTITWGRTCVWITPIAAWPTGPTTQAPALRRSPWWM